MNRWRMKRLFLALGVLLALTLPAHAQQGTGTVSGSVVDESGAIVPGAVVQLTGPGVNKFNNTASDGTYKFANVPAGAQKVTVTLTGFSPEVRDVAVTAGANTDVPAVTLKITVHGEEVVVSASKVESALINAPATMNVIASDTIATSPAQNYGDLLRSVPGLNVIQLSARDVNITSRQSTGTLANSQLTLLDGRTIYLDFFGLILWDFVPNAPSEIKQIEVVRGPASAVWGANALTGVVNIITKSPREAVGTNVTLTGGTFNRDGGSRESEGDGNAFGANVSFAQAPNDRFSYKISAGYYHSEPYSRPVGTVPLSTHPLAGTPTGGAPYPADKPGQLGAFENTETNQPKADVRLDWDLSNGGRITYGLGYAGTKGIIHTGIGPFDIQSGSYMGYSKLNYTKGALKVNLFGNIVDAEAPNLLLLDPATLKPVQLNFKTQTYDLEFGHSTVLGGKHVLSYGGNARRNNFDITLTPNGKDRWEFGGYFQEEFFLEKFRLALGARVDKFGNIDKAVFSPRVTAMFKPAPSHSFRVSFNRAFRSPSVVNNFLDQNIFAPSLIDLRALRPLAQGFVLLGLLPPASFVKIDPFLSRPFPLVVRNVGNENLKEESLNAFEVAYTGTFGGKTTVGIAFYQNDSSDNINFTRVTPSAENPRGLPGFDVYTPANAAGGGLPPELIAFLASVPAQFRGPIFLPRTVATYLNLAGTRQRGFELSLDHSFSNEVSAYANYSFQDEPERRDPEAGQLATPLGEIGIPPRHRFNAGINVNTKRFLGSASINYTDKAFWTDVLTSEFDGQTDSYAMVNATFGVKWADGKVTTSIKATNIFNETIQQHTFGDILKRSIFGEVRFKF